MDGMRIPVAGGEEGIKPGATAKGRLMTLSDSKREADDLEREKEPRSGPDLSQNQIKSGCRVYHV